MHTISASEFKAKCLAIIDEVGDAGQPVVITKRGRPVAELVRYVNREEGTPQETLRGSLRINGDIVAPVVAVSDWSSAGS
ncbi:MAG: type II toxin-antitoxin system Phd/YefM family antitoxin [Spirochaetaceae bacterium]|nr:MAG: type II toxin-antitoxin system Phd/YefM family antitoxin [Spirochaetaceae bacterium]